MKRHQQSGFTLIELVVVIVILGILAATAIPKFVDLSDEASEAALKGVAGNMSSAMAINYASCAALGYPEGTGINDKCKPVSNCKNVYGLLQDGKPQGYAVNDKEIVGKLGSVESCTVWNEKKGDKLLSFSAIKTAEPAAVP